MRLKPFRPEDLGFFPDEPALPESVGCTLWRDGRAMMCGGVAPCAWGMELWIYVQPDVTPGEKRRIAKVARSYVRSMLTVYDALFAHARGGNERWLEFLGLELEEDAIDPNGQPYQRWKIEREEAAWVSK